MLVQPNLLFSTKSESEPTTKKAMKHAQLRQGQPVLFVPCDCPVCHSLRSAATGSAFAAADVVVVLGFESCNACTSFWSAANASLDSDSAVEA